MGVIVEFCLPQFLSPILLELHSPACRKLDFNTLNKNCSHIINIEMHDHWYWFCGSVTSRPVTLILLAFPHGCSMINVAPAIMTIFKIGKKRKWEGLGMHEQYLWNKTKTKKYFSEFYSSSYFYLCLMAPNLAKCQSWGTREAGRAGIGIGWLTQPIMIHLLVPDDGRKWMLVTQLKHLLYLFSGRENVA